MWVTISYTQQHTDKQEQSHVWHSPYTLPVTHVTYTLHTACHTCVSPPPSHTHWLIMYTHDGTLTIRSAHTRQLHISKLNWFHNLKVTQLLNFYPLGLTRGSDSHVCLHLPPYNYNHHSKLWTNINCNPPHQSNSLLQPLYQSHSPLQTSDSIIFACSISKYICLSKPNHSSKKNVSLK